MIFQIEVISVAKRLGVNISRKDVNKLVSDFELLNEDLIFDEAFKIAEEIHPRAIDTYFIATASITNSILISSDKTMINNARNYNVTAYYLLDELEEILKKTRELKEI